MALWDMLHLRIGSSLSGKEFFLFQSTKGRDTAETNLFAPGRVPGDQAFNVYCVAFNLTRAPVTTPVEQLALQNRERRDQEADILATGIFEWVFGATRFSGSPLWLEQFQYTQKPIYIPSRATFAVRVVFGKEGPTLDYSYTLRCALHGYYESALDIG